MLEMLFTRAPKSEILLNLCTAVLTVVNTLSLPAVLCLASQRAPQMLKHKQLQDWDHRKLLASYDLISQPIITKAETSVTAQ